MRLVVAVAVGVVVAVASAHGDTLTRRSYYMRRVMRGRRARTRS